MGGDGYRKEGRFRTQRAGRRKIVRERRELSGIGKVERKQLRCLEEGVTQRTTEEGTERVGRKKR